MSAGKPTEFRFEPPGPGFWELDLVHFPRPMTRYWTEVHPEPFKRGSAEFARSYGLLIDGLEMAYVNGFAYKAVKPAAKDQLPERSQRAEEVFKRKLWREQLRDWNETVKPTSIKAHRELQSVDPEGLSDADLAAHLKRCRDHHAEMIYQHMRFTAAAVVPTGDFLAHVGDWTGLSPAELLGLMRGTSPVSAGASAQLAQLITAIRQDPRAQKLLEPADDPGRVLQALRSLDRNTGAAVAAYLELIGYRLLDGFDISNPCALELPDVLCRAIRAAGAGTGAEASEVEGRIADVRRKVPARHRAQFDELLEEARLTYPIRDERGVFSDIWASGLMRRAALAGGRRLARKGRIHDAVHFVDAGLDEMRALLSGADGPSADELAKRVAYRATHNAKDAPSVLGSPPPPPPDPAGLPPAAGRMTRAIGLALGALFGSSEAPHEEHMLRGLAASRGVYAGPARRVSHPSEFDRIKKGDVLVTESTTEAFNILLPLLGGIVTDNGGLLSHAAIVSREYGIPGVVGTREATERIADGVLVRVDGDAGEVTVRWGASCRWTLHQERGPASRSGSKGDAMPIRVFLADDHAVVRDGLRFILEDQGDISVVGEAADGRLTVREVQRLRPDVVIMDIAMPEMNGIEATLQVRDASPSTQVLILSMHATAEHIFWALQAGARGYLLKESAGKEVVEAVRAVSASRRYLSQGISETVLDEFTRTDRPAHGKSPLESLSTREREILQLVVEGKSSAEIAEVLRISPKTVETYRSRLMQKLGLSDLPSLVKFAIQHGLTPLK